jgi:hypothetical protein
MFDVLLIVLLGVVVILGTPEAKRASAQNPKGKVPVFSQ